MSGTWHGLVRGARTVIPAVIASALGQTLLLVGDPVPRADWIFVMRAIASTSVMVASIWLIVGAGATAVDVDARWSLPSVRLLSGVTGVVVVGILAGIVSPVLPVLVAAAGLPILSALAVRPWASPIRTVMFSPLRAMLGFVLVSVLFVADWASALLLGFFVAGPGATTLTWVVFGISAAVLATFWADLHRRASTQAETERRSTAGSA